jgi:integrase
LTRKPKQDADLPPGIFRRGDRYRVIVYAGLDPVTGKQRRIAATASTPREAVKVHARLVVEVGKGRHRSGVKLTVAELLERYLRQLQAADRSPSTIDRVRSAADTTINPRIGRLDVAKLDEDALNDLYNELRAHGRRCQVCWARLRRGLNPLRDGESYQAWRRKDAIHAGDCVNGQPMAPATVLRIHGILSAALAGAPRKLLDRNPARDAKTPKVRRSQIRPPEHQDVARLLAAAADTDPEWAVWLRLDTMTGGRRGEICAIRIPKIDFATGMVRMDRNIIHTRGADGRGEHRDVKTKADTAKSPVLDPETLRLVGELVRR